jgi:hypothetical protein
MRAGYADLIASLDEMDAGVLLPHPADETSDIIRKVHAVSMASEETEAEEMMWPYSKDHIHLTSVHRAHKSAYGSDLIVLPPFSISPRTSGTNDIDDNLPSGMAFREIAKGFGNLIQRTTPIYDRHNLSCIKNLAQESKILGFRPG